jgi:hypothetical protein
MIDVLATGGTRGKVAISNIDLGKYCCLYRYILAVAVGDVWEECWTGSRAVCPKASAEWQCHNDVRRGRDRYEQ